MAGDISSAIPPGKEQGTMIKKSQIILAAFCGSICSLSAAPIDLSTWHTQNLDFPGAQPAANWQLQPGNTAVLQAVNADPSFFLNGKNQTSYSIDGSWRVNTISDDDYMGFVFGYQNSSRMYMFDWKQSQQSDSGALAEEGMTIKRFTGATGNGLVDLSIAELWENANNRGDMTVLAKNHGSTMGWLDNTSYDFHLDYNLNPGDIHIRISQGATTLWDTTINDTTFNGGEFGFYNNSQGSVLYEGFVQTGGVSAPDSGQSIALLGFGMISLLALTRFRSAQVG